MSTLNSNKSDVPPKNQSTCITAAPPTGRSSGFQPLFHLAVHPVTLFHLVELFQCSLHLFGVALLDGIVEPVVLSGRTGRHPVQGKTIAVHKPLHVRGIARNRLQQLPVVAFQLFLQ